jgi:type II secretory pathway pseudopilin PulG
MVELIFVVVIIAVAAAITIPAIGSGRRQREVRQTMQRFVSAVRQASSTAVFDRRRVELRVWPDLGEYGIVRPQVVYVEDAEVERDQRDRRTGRAAPGRFGKRLVLERDEEELEEQDEVLHRFFLPDQAVFGDIEGGRSSDLAELGTISFDFFPTGSSSGGIIEFVFGEGSSRQVYLLTLNPLVSSVDLEVGE